MLQWAAEVASTDDPPLVFSVSWGPAENFATTAGDPLLASRSVQLRDFCTITGIRMFFSWFWMQIKNRCCSTPRRSQKLRFVVTTVSFGAHHLKGTHTPGEGSGPKVLRIQKKGENHVSKCMVAPCPKTYLFKDSQHKLR